MYNKLWCDRDSFIMTGQGDVRADQETEGQADGIEAQQLDSVGNRREVHRQGRVTSVEPIHHVGLHTILSLSAVL